MTANLIDDGPTQLEALESIAYELSRIADALEAMQEPVVVQTVEAC